MRCVDLANYVTSEGAAVEHPAVVIPLVTQHYSMLRRNLVYTAVTRGQRLVVVVGRPEALALAVKGARARRRWSKLGEGLSKSSVGSGPSGTIAAYAAAPTVDGA